MGDVQRQFHLVDGSLRVTFPRVALHSAHEPRAGSRLEQRTIGTNLIEFDAVDHEVEVRSRGGKFALCQLSLRALDLSVVPKHLLVGDRLPSFELVLERAFEQVPQLLTHFGRVGVVGVGFRKVVNFLDDLSHRLLQPREFFDGCCITYWCADFGHLLP